MADDGECLPEPMTAADCDLTDFKFMPLEVVRLRKSKAWLFAKREPEIGFYAINLWAMSWHEVPAASLEDDDDVLADYAMCSPERWPDVREKVLRGWVKCSDGRLYHATVAEKAKESWERKQEQRHRTEGARRAREAKRQAMLSGHTQHVTDVATTSVTDNVANDVTDSVAIATEIATSSKGQGQGQGQKEEPSSLRSDAPVVELDPGKALFGEGLETLARLAGKPADKVRGFLGKCRNAMKDDAGLLELIRTAERELIVDPLAWLTATVKCRSGPPLLAAIDDPWGIRAWSSRQADAKLETDARTGKQVLAINGYLIEASADVVAEAAGLPESWRGNWDALGGWMRADIELTAEVLAAISGHAGRLGSISSIAVFDSTVRSVRRAA